MITVLYLVSELLPLISHFKLKGKDTLQVFPNHIQIILGILL